MGHSRIFSFQLQFKRGIAADDALIDEVICVVKNGGGHVTEKSMGEEDGEVFATINAETENPRVFWRKTRPKLTAASLDQHLKGVIVVCEGENGWDDYLLLQHPDASQKIDRLGRDS
ncbi:MAG TPA: hypothetical protein VGG99_24440 [Acetobacteraceae bacterium]|jgi:hypothetical protein